MPLDNKYGRVELEHGEHIPDDEPGIWFRAKDRLLPALLRKYEELCAEAGSPPRHLNLIAETRGQIAEWQSENETKTPDSETSRAWRS